MGTIKAVLFDNDGTLLDTYQLILDSFNHAYRQVLGRTFSEQETMQKVGQPLVVQIRDFTDDEEIAEEILRAFRAYNEAIHDQRARVYEGCVETLAALHAAGYRMAVVTSKRHALAQHGIEVFGIAPYMEFLVGADDCPAHKPHPGSILFACERMGLAPQECAYVGDSPFDMQAANAAGCKSIAALWGMYPRDVLAQQHPDAFCQHISDIPLCL